MEFWPTVMAEDIAVDTARVAIVIPTRGRPQSLARCLASVFAVRPSGCAVVVVDQSSDAETESVVEELAGSEADFVYLRVGSSGVSAARNGGADLASDAGLLLFVDDDCEIADHWVEAWQELFATDPSFGLGFGWVTAASFDASEGHIPHFDPGPRVTTWGVEIFRKGAESVGMGANMAMRRAAWADVGGFDESLGAGTLFLAGEELDLAYRIARSRYRLVHARGVPVLHWGYRHGEDASILGRGYAYGTGAMYLKLARCRDLGAVHLLTREICHLAWVVVRNTVTGKRPTGFNSLRSFLQGVMASRHHALDVAHRIYRRPLSDMSAATVTVALPKPT